MQATLCPPQRGALTLIAVEVGNGRRLGYVHAHPSRDGVTDEPCGHVAIIVTARLKQRGEVSPTA